MPTKTFINLAVTNLNKTIGFFTRLGFTFNEEFTDAHATCMIISDNCYVMLLTEPFFKKFTKKHVADSHKTTEVIIALSAESQEKVDEMCKTAFEAGGKKYKEVDDKDNMYGWGFQDLDGHLWEVIYMKPNQVVKV